MERVRYGYAGLRAGEKVRPARMELASRENSIATFSLVFIPQHFKMYSTSLHVNPELPDENRVEEISNY